MAKHQEEQRKKIIEYKDEGKVVARWHYDLDVFTRGPILVEELALPPKQKRSKSKKPKT